MPISTIDFYTQAALGLNFDYIVDNKFGRNPSVDTGTVPEDIWNVGGVYTGHPEGFTPERVEVFSSDANDTSAGTGARTIRMFGLESATSTAYTSEDITLDGTNPVQSTKSWYRINRAFVLTAGTGATNAGTITIRPITTTSAVFAVMPIGFAQTSICAWTVPYNCRALIKTTHLGIKRLNAQAGSGTVTLRTRTVGGVFRARVIYELTTDSVVDDEFLGGVLLEALTDVKMTVETVSANSTVAEADFSYVLYSYRA